MNNTMLRIRSDWSALKSLGITTKPVPEADNPEHWLTKNEAIALIYAWRDANIPKENLDFGYGMKKRITSGSEYVYLMGLTDELIKRINLGNEDPITEVAIYYYWIDEVNATSDDGHFVTHRFASFMENAAHDILNYLQKKEKEKMENELKRMVR